MHAVVGNCLLFEGLASRGTVLVKPLGEVLPHAGDLDGARVFIHGAPTPGAVCWIELADPARSFFGRVIGFTRARVADLRRSPNAQ